MVVQFNESYSHLKTVLQKLGHCKNLETVVQYAKKCGFKRDTQRRRQATKKAKIARKRNKMRRQQKDILTPVAPVI